MGVSFGASVKKKVGNKYISVHHNPDKGCYYDKDLPRCGFANVKLTDTIFRDHRDKIIKFSKIELNFDIYDISETELMNPIEPLNFFNEIKRIFIEHEYEFPKFFAWTVDGKNFNDYNGHIYTDKRFMILVVDETKEPCLIDEESHEKAILSVGSEIKGYIFYKYDLLKELSAEEIIKREKKGEELNVSEELTFKIVEQNIYEHFKFIFDKMINLCEYCKEKGYKMSFDRR